ncbi:52 kDa repressor of the inhibitor of the protein kinase [Frankliniella fusca]|uniref:52 kDa repressor of the inhibitor of the protein kinase n=1 Tax=Frankliniella fusca TaxID=407009 RepID=A0AAE1LUH4_9NEOP|nr:52 kDa repressor of the inhibitor of the protein kinase [Frankliniella fusca]
MGCNERPLAATQPFPPPNVGSLVNFALKSFSKLYGRYGALDNHEKNKYHIDAVGAGKDFVHTYKSPPSNIVNRLDAQRLESVQDNRNRLKPILKTIVFCGQQNVSLRGHRDDGILMDEDQGSQGSIVVNDGNFRSLLRFRIEAGDENLKTHLEKSSCRSTYIGKNTQVTSSCGAVKKFVRKSAMKLVSHPGSQ